MGENLGDPTRIISSAFRRNERLLLIIFSMNHGKTSCRSFVMGDSQKYYTRSVHGEGDTPEGGYEGPRHTTWLQQNVRTTF